MKPRLILASASPRRRLLLEEAGYLLEVDPSGFRRAGAGDPSFARRTTRLTWHGERRPTVARRRKTGLVLGADTVCDVRGQILNKPLDRATPNG